MARTIGPTAASTQVALAVALERMPLVFALFAAGTISEATARAVTAETACLSVDHFCLADAELAKNTTIRVTYRIAARPSRTRSSQVIPAPSSSATTT